MRGIWRIRRALDRLEAMGARPEPLVILEPVVQPIAPPVDNRPLPRGLWMPKEQPLAYVVVPKSACTTAGQYLYYADHGYYFYDDVHRMRHGLHKGGLDPHAIRTRLDVAGDDLFTFSFVRDPYARLVSGFLDKVVDLDQGYRSDIRERVASDWGVQLAGDRSQVENFKSFMGFVEYQYQKWEEFQQLEPGQPDAREPWEKVDIHWLRQSWYLRRGRRHAGRLDFIGSTETMTDDLEQITTHVSPPHSPHMADMPKFGLGPKREAPLEDFYDDESKAIVDRYFAPDFTLFGYPKVVGGAPEQLDGFERAARFEASREPVEGEQQDIDDDDEVRDDDEGA